MGGVEIAAQDQPLPTGPLPTGRQAVLTEGGAGPEPSMVQGRQAEQPQHLCWEVERVSKG
jgi:hypothetical protein